METNQLQKLATQLQNGNDRQRRVASYKLSKSKDPSVVPALMSAYNDKDSAVRRNVFDGLRSIGSEEALDFLASHKETPMNVIPSMDSRNIECDSNGVVTIKSRPLVGYVVWGIVVILGIGALVRGEITLGIVGIVAGVIAFIRSRSQGTSFEFNPKTRIFKIGSGPKAINISFDDIAAFAVATEKETGNFTKEEIMVVLKDGKGIQIGVITDANEKAREEKVANLMKFLNKTTGI
jgi:hypothetical protein